MTFRAAFLAKRKAAFVLNQCPPNYRSARASEAAKGLTSLGVLAEPLLSARMDYQDALAGGFGVTEFSRGGRAAREVEALWRWSHDQIGPVVEPPAANQNKNRVVVAAA
jgi:chromosome partitioning protein